jgi:hypothetical protein
MLLLLPQVCIYIFYLSFKEAHWNLVGIISFFILSLMPAISYLYIFCATAFFIFILIEQINL